MAGINISNDFSGIRDILNSYRDDVAQAAKNAVDSVSEKMNETIKEHVTFGGSGKYVKAFKIKTLYENNLYKHNVWYVKSPHYRLTHILEKGHAARDGSRVRAFPHIEYGANYVNENLQKEIAERIEKL